MSAVSLYYYLVLLKTMYVVEPDSGAVSSERIAAPPFLSFGLLVSLAVVIWTGLAPQQVLSWIENFVNYLPL